MGIWVKTETKNEVTIQRFNTRAQAKGYKQMIKMAEKYMGKENIYDVETLENFCFLRVSKNHNQGEENNDNN